MTDLYHIIREIDSVWKFIHSYSCCLCFLTGLKSGSTLKLKTNMLTDLPKTVWEDIFIALKGTNTIEMDGMTGLAFCSIFYVTLEFFF